MSLLNKSERANRIKGFFPAKTGYGLYLITDGSVKDELSETKLLSRVEEALKGGAGFIQLREKVLDTERLKGLAIRMRALTLSYSAGLIINSDITVAIASGADGLHLPSTGFGISAAREGLGDEALIGVSTHSIEEAKRAQREGADFITFGPVYYTESKAEYGEPIGLKKLKDTVDRLDIPVFGLGGIGRAQVTEVLSTGAGGVALISAILSRPDILAATREIIDQLDKQKRVASI